MHSDQFTVDKRLNGMYFKYPWGSMGFLWVKRRFFCFQLFEYLKKKRKRILIKNAF